MHRWGFVAALLASPGLGVLSPTPRHADVAEQVIREHPDLAGNLFRDTHTVVLMREHGKRRICTRDTDFHRFANLQVVDPL
jgi:predicted nucleic acid-binding protein